jgi:aminoglycoside phosphotransferase (APT) family kinase protein
VTLAGSGIAPAPVHFNRGRRPVVVMERVSGSSLAADALEARHATAIGSAHRLVHGTTHERQRELPHAGLKHTRSSLGRDLEDSAWMRSDSTPLVGRAWRAAQAWFADVDLDRLVSPERLRFSRGDPNLSNYLWSEDGLLLVDWENSGYNDPALELADMAEHASTRPLSDDFWPRLPTQPNSSDRTTPASLRVGEPWPASGWSSSRADSVTACRQP